MVNEDKEITNKEVIGKEIQRKKLINKNLQMKITENTMKTVSGDDGNDENRW